MREMTWMWAQSSVISSYKPPPKPNKQVNKQTNIRNILNDQDWIEFKLIVLSWNHHLTNSAFWLGIFTELKREMLPLSTVPMTWMPNEILETNKKRLFIYPFILCINWEIGAFRFLSINLRSSSVKSCLSERRLRLSSIHISEISHIWQVSFFSGIVIYYQRQLFWGKQHYFFRQTRFVCM